MRKLVISVCTAFLLLAAMAAPATAATVNTYQMLVNKNYLLSTDYVPASLVTLSDYTNASSSVTLERTAAEALAQMIKGARDAGVKSLYGASGYRSYDTQVYLSNRKTNYYLSLGYSRDEAYRRGATVVAPPGASEHQTGLAIDLLTSENGNSMTESFATTKAGKWLAANCYKYGFILRYAADKVDTTGYIYEPWHFRYVGAPHAEYMYKNGLCLEEYLQKLRAEQDLIIVDAAGQAYTVYYDLYNTSADKSGALVNVSTALAHQGGYLITERPFLYDVVGHWSELEVRSLVDLDVINGYPDKSFRPQRDVSRAELSTLIYRVFSLIFDSSEDEPVANDDNTQPAADEPIVTDDNQPPAADASIDSDAPLFADVTSELYYYQPLLFDYEHGLLAESMIEVHENELFFRGSEPALRREVALCVAPLFDESILTDNEQATPVELADMTTESEELRKAVLLLMTAEAVKGDDMGNFNPNQCITRAEMAALLNRTIERLSPTTLAPDEETDNTEESTTQI